MRRVSSEKAILIAAVLVLIIVVAYSAKAKPDWSHLDYWKAHYVEGPDQIYDRSDGSYDEAAALALQRSLDIPAPAAADHLRAATIIYRNIVSQGHRRAAQPGSDEDRELSALREEMCALARAHYWTALAKLTDETIARDEAARAVRRYNLPETAPQRFRSGGEAPPRGELPGQPGAEFIIDAALEFAHSGLETLRPDEKIVELARDRRETANLMRRAAAAEVADSLSGGCPGVRAAAFLDLSRRNTSDSQNSYDPSITAAVKAIVARLRSEQVGGLPTFDDLVEELRAGGDDFSRDPRSGQPRPALTERALAVVQRIRSGAERFGAASPQRAPASDGEILRLVWARADDDRNANRRALMRQAVFDALVGCWERGIGEDKIQCAAGRVARLIGSLAWLDADASNWGLRKLEQLKNEFYSKAAQVIRAAAAEAAAMGVAVDAELAKVGRAYLATTPAEFARVGAVDPEKEKMWLEATRARVERALDTYAAALNRSAPGTIPGYVAESLKKEACAALAC